MEAAWRLWVIVAAVLLLALSLWGQSMAPTAPNGGGTGCHTNRYRLAQWETNSVDPGYYRRHHRTIIRVPGGCVGIRVCASNACPAVLRASVNGCAWHFVTVVTSNTVVEFWPTNGVELWEIK